MFGPLLEVDMWKSALGGGAKHSLKWKLSKHTRFRPLWEVEKKWTPSWHEAHLEAKSVKTPQLRNTFGSWGVETVRAVVARSTCGSKNVQNTSAQGRFSKLRFWKSARCCGTKQICKSKCAKHARFGSLLEVEMSKKCTPMRRKAHLDVKSCKTHRSRHTFGCCDVHLEATCVKNWVEPIWKCRMFLDG